LSDIVGSFYLSPKGTDFLLMEDNEKQQHPSRKIGGGQFIVPEASGSGPTKKELFAWLCTRSWVQWIAWVREVLEDEEGPGNAG
jgi:hypothetical protein